MIFDAPLKRRRPPGASDLDVDIDLDTLKAQVPDADRAMDEIDRAIEAAEQVKDQKERPRSCCWG